MPVAELLERMSMEELASWQAYEVACGELGDNRILELLAAQHEQLQLMNWMYAQAKFSGETDDGYVVNFLGETPREGIKRVARPHDGLRTVGPGDILSGAFPIEAYDRIYNAADPDPDLDFDDPEDGEAE